MAEVFIANPSNYLTLLRNLAPGDTLMLEPGIYDDSNDVPGLPFFNMNGEPDKPIVISGAETGNRPVFLGRSTHNTVRFDNASYIEIRNIVIDGRNLGGDGVKAQGISHHIMLENLLIKGVGSDQQIVGINTKAPAWKWVIRNCVIIEAGTGMYFGNSDGSVPFVNGLIEYNLIVNTLGYNLQIKHQIDRPARSGVPGDGTTIIRHNVFSKAENASTGGAARPNLLVGHWPLTGAGSSDVYQIYGNFFYQNPTGEALFQGEGNIALYNNLFVNRDGDAVRIQPHNDVPKMIRIFNNTVVSRGTGIRVTGGDPGQQQKVIGNAVFAANQISAVDQNDNITDTFENASNYLSDPTGIPSGSPGSLDLYPLVDRLTGPRPENASYRTFVHWDRDFNGDVHDGTFRGAYAGEGQNSGWPLKLEIKPPIEESDPVHVPERTKQRNNFELQQNFPNPFNSETSIMYEIAGSDASNLIEVRLEIFNLLGQKIRSLVKAFMQLGNYQVTWSGRDDLGRPLPSGVYVYQFQAASSKTSRKLLLLR